MDGINTQPDLGHAIMIGYTLVYCIVVLQVLYYRKSSGWTDDNMGNNELSAGVQGTTKWN